jgi:hypothetical protein
MVISLVLILVGQGFFWMTYGQDAGDRKQEIENRGIVIKKEEGPAGHSTIGIDEASVLERGREFQLTFSTLMSWNYEIDAQSPPPESIGSLNGRTVRLTGFMYPLQQGESIQYFCLLRTTQTCCYGPRPQYNQYVLVEMEEPTRFYRLDPVICVGKFYVEPTPDEGFIYRMEGNACESSTRK